MARSGEAHWLVALLVLAIYVYIFGSGIQRQVQRQKLLQANAQPKGVAARFRR
jgi:hypothetical protein